jgi:glutathione synthase/RimK-type ligase-like ATP-grasp enzyme
MNKVLVLTYGEDPHANSVCNYFSDKNIDFLRVDTEKIIKDYKLTFDSKDSSYTLENKFRKEKIDPSWNIWNRRLLDPDFVKRVPKNIEEMIFEETERTWNGLLSTHEGKVVNRPLNQQYANNKINQLMLSSKIGKGVYTPKTIVTNNPDEAKRFYEENNRNVCFKLQKGIIVDSPRGYLTVYTNKVTEEQMKNSNLISSHPCLFQEYVDKDYEIRIVSTDKTHTGIAIHSQKSDLSKVDYRKYDFDNVPYNFVELPENVKIFCADMLGNYKLSFGVFDFIYSKKGEYAFLELNPNGQWLWLEDRSGYNLTEHVAQNLIS